MAKDKIGLIYKGNGFYAGVPARDLSETEIKQYGLEFLLSLGLYEELKAEPKHKEYETKNDPFEKEQED